MRVPVNEVRGVLQNWWVARGPCSLAFTHRLHSYNLEMRFRSSCLSHAVTSPFSFHGPWMEHSPLRSRYAIGLCCPAYFPETP